MKFIGGPFMSGCHEAIRDYLTSVYGPIPPAPTFHTTDEDIIRAMPRHYPLSIPSDPVPGFPFEHVPLLRRSRQRLL